jgi:hypothetical protein
MSSLHDLARRSRIPVLSACLTWTILLSAADHPLFAQEESDKPKTWEGTWTNRRYNSSGPLKCTAVKKPDGAYEARFEGTFMGSPFDYNVPVKVTPGDDRTLLEGDPTIDGDPYEWTGYVRGGILYGRFRSAKGHNGEFRLRESKE